MSKIKIVHFITEIVLGGAQRSTLNTIKYLGEEEYEHFLLTSLPVCRVESFQDDFEDISGLEIVWLRNLVRSISLFKDISSFLYLLWFLRVNQIALIHTHSSKAGFIGRWAAFFTKTKAVHTVHGFSFNDYQSVFVRKLYIYLEKVTALITDKLIFIAKADLQKAASYFIGDKNKYILIRDVIDLDSFLNDLSLNEYLQIKGEFGFADQDFIIGCVACFKKQKGLELFLRAVQIVKAKNKSIKVIMVGDGDKRKEIVDLVKQFALEEVVQLLGWRKDVCEIMKILDIIVLSSWWEGLPLVVLEAMASKLAVLATRVNGLAEVINEGENGFLVAPGDSAGLAAKILFLSNNRNIARQMGEKGFSFIRNNQEFSRIETIKQIKRVYLDVCGS